MRKLLCRTSAVILALSIVGCDSLPFLGGAGEEEATPESSPSPTAEAPASPSPSPTPTPTPFASPDVPQKPPRASALTQSSNAEERVSQLERQIGGQAPPATSDTTSGRDPFAVDIPIPPPPEPGDNGGGTAPIDGPVVVTQLPSQRVPQIPSLPEISAPPQLGGPQPSPLPGGGGGTARQPGGGTARQPGGGTARQPGGGTATQPGGGTATQPGQPTGPNRDSGQISDLAKGQVPELPKLGELNRPPQVGGTTLVGDVPPIRLTPLQEELINGFRTVDALTDETSKLSEYSTDLSDNIGMAMRTREIRRELLLSNRALYRRLEKVLFEYELAARLWDFYGGESPPDALRCSSITAIEQAINIYGPPTVLSGQLRCVERMELLDAVWARGNDILDAALRDRDFDARSLADTPSLPNAGEPTQLGQLPQVPEFERPATGTPNLPDAGGPTQLGQPPLLPPFEIPQEERAGGGETLPPPPPPPPSTALAEGVKVTGVVEVGNKKQIIIEAPNEATSRYVEVGQRVAGGKVLVKRVDFENGEAIVILEENDIEIRKAIGEEPAAAE